MIKQTVENDVLIAKLLLSGKSCHNCAISISGVCFVVNEFGARVCRKHKPRGDF